MKLMQSRGEFGVHVTIGPPVGERIITIKKDDVVDFDEVVVPARPGREQMTLRQALGYQAARTVVVNDVEHQVDESLGLSQYFDEYVESATAEPTHTAAAPTQE